MELLLVAQSARMLAQSAARAGLRCLAVDGFADADTRDCTAHCTAVSPGPSGFDAAQLLAAVNAIAPPNGDSALVYGSGIDNRPGLVECLVRGRKLLGNSPETLRHTTSPKLFFRLLDELGIPYPETRFAPPLPDGAWLRKPHRGEGGKGVGWYSGNPGLSGEVYYQRWVSGDAYSLLFLADGKEIRSLGFNTQWTARHEPAQPFWFAGCINRAELNAAQRQSVEAYALMLTAATGLVGLNSLDFVVEGGACKILEINPRPSASMALYDGDFERGLLALHIAACLGQLPPPFDQTSPLRALRIVYSPWAIRIPKGFQWPKECADLPLPLAEIAAGQPLCSLLVQAENRQQAKNLVKLIENNLLCGLLGRLPPTRPSSIAEKSQP